MKIVVMEPLGVKMELINALAAPLQAAGHDFVYYTEKDTDRDEAAGTCAAGPILSCWLISR